MFYGFKFLNLCLISDTLVIRKMAYNHFTVGLDSWIITQKFFQINHRLCLTFGGMCMLPQLEGGEVFAIVLDIEMIQVHEII